MFEMFLWRLKTCSSWPDPRLFSGRWSGSEQQKFRKNYLIETVGLSISQKTFFSFLVLDTPHRGIFADKHLKGQWRLKNLRCRRQNPQKLSSINRDQVMKRFFEGKFGSLVRLTPNLLNPASSPGVGIWVIWISQLLSSFNFSIAN